MGAAGHCLGIGGHWSAQGEENPIFITCGFFGGDVVIFEGGGEGVLSLLLFC